MSSFDPRQTIQARIDSVGVRPTQVQGLQAAFQLGCDGEGCDASDGATSVFGLTDSRQLIAEAHQKGFTTDETLRQYILQVLRARAFQAGWVVGRGPGSPEGKDYCPSCIRKGRCPGDDVRTGSGRKQMRRGDDHG